MGKKAVLGAIGCLTLGGGGLAATAVVGGVAAWFLWTPSAAPTLDEMSGLSDAIAEQQAPAAAAAIVAPEVEPVAAEPAVAEAAPEGAADASAAQSTTTSTSSTSTRSTSTTSAASSGTAKRTSSTKTQTASRSVEPAPEPEPEPAAAEDDPEAIDAALEGFDPSKYQDLDAPEDEGKRRRRK